MSDYTVVLTRSVPVDSGQDTIILNVSQSDTMGDVMKWVDRHCQGMCFPIRVEIVKGHTLSDAHDNDYVNENNGEQEAPY